MLSRYGRPAAARLFGPPARLLVRMGISPDVVTLVGTLGVSAAALWFIPRGQFVAGVVVMLLFVFSDTLDGTMARQIGRSSAWGAYLDSTLDRVSDAAVFASVALYYADGGDDAMVWVSLAALVGALLVSYARARAEGLGMTADVGVAERTERLGVLLLGLLLSGLGVPYALAIAVWLVAVGTWLTVAHRILYVRRQAMSR